MDNEVRERIEKFKSNREDGDIFSVMVDMASEFGSKSNDLKVMFGGMLEEFAKILAAMGNSGVVLSECVKCGSKIFVKDGCPLDCKVCEGEGVSE